MRLAEQKMRERPRGADEVPLMANKERRLRGQRNPHLHQNATCSLPSSGQFLGMLTGMWMCRADRHLMSLKSSLWAEDLGWEDASQSSHPATPPGAVGLDQVYRANLWVTLSPFLTLLSLSLGHPSATCRPMPSSPLHAAHLFSGFFLLSLDRSRWPGSHPLHTVIYPFIFRDKGWRQ